MLIVRDGTIRSCPAVRLFYNLENRFSKHLTEEFKMTGNSPENYMIIDDICNAKAIIGFMKKRIPLCDYCDLRGRHSMGEWRHSTGKMEEWINVEG